MKYELKGTGGVSHWTGQHEERSECEEQGKMNLVEYEFIWILALF